MNDKEKLEVIEKIIDQHRFLHVDKEILEK